MAPAATTTPGVSWEAKGFKTVDKTKTIRVQEDGLKYPEYYPYNDPNDKFPDPEPFDYHERALDADPSLPVFYNDHVTVEEVHLPYLSSIAWLMLLIDHPVHRCESHRTGLGFA